MDKNITHFYFDMDGVLTDFPGYCKNHCPLDHCDYSDKNRKAFKAWLQTQINHVETEIFKNLSPSPYIDDMFILKEKLKKKGIIVSTLTSLGGHHHTTKIHSQKKMWLDAHGFSDILYLSVNECHEKKYLAHPKALLLDDHLKNCQEFITMSGNSIYYNFDSHQESIEKIEKII